MTPLYTDQDFSPMRYTLPKPKESPQNPEISAVEYPLPPTPSTCPRTESVALKVFKEMGVRQPTPHPSKERPKSPSPERELNSPLMTQETFPSFYTMD